MHPILARRVIIPLHELALGRGTFGYRRFLEESQWWSPEDLLSLQRRKLSAALLHAFDVVEFWRVRIGLAWSELQERRFDKESNGLGALTIAGSGVRSMLGWESIDPFELLCRMPLLSKDEIRANLPHMVWSGCPGAVVASHTGGSTGAPLKFFLDRSRQASDQAARMRSHGWFGVAPGDRELYVWGSPQEQRRMHLRRWRDRCFNHRLLNAFDMSANTMADYWREYHRFSPACVFGYPSSLAFWVDHAVKEGLAVDHANLRCVFVTGERCDEHDRSKIASFFGVPVANGYGSREGGFIAHECPAGSMHVTAESVIVEIVDANGGVVAPGSTGEIVITHLDSPLMPLFRYRTGDVGRLSPGRCSCGRGLSRMAVVEGRTTDFIRLPDGTVQHALSVIYPLRETPGISRFRVIQEADMALRALVVADAVGFDRCVESDLLRRLRRSTRDMIPVCIERVERIEPSASGKHRFVESQAGACSETVTNAR